MATKDYDELYKVLLIGDSAVGKSSLLERFTKNQFALSFVPTIGIDFQAKILEVDGKRIKLQVWDTAGQERFRTITTAYFRSAMGILMIYDCSDTKTFTEIRSWADAVEMHAPESIVKQIVANKVDKTEGRTVSKQKGRDLAKDYNVEYFETSAKSGEGVEEAFQKLAEAIYEQQKNIAADDDSMFSFAPHLSHQLLISVTDS
eukprot:TRINITY_DN454_c0_g1_i2.p1 TRINITY_DN454_c0_g1~~TRINITY_DN454_c0_g1_i2.p1  ORF type:complete len:203 (-),score=39.17 TRINITY_DN454_c0_g1_i2:252-860(-)